MNYVEWLRVRGCLRATAIVLGVVVLLGIIMRIWTSPYLTTDKWIKHFQNEPGTKASTSVLADGTKRTVIESPKDNTRVVIDDRGYGGRHIQVTEPQSRAKDHDDNVAIGSISVHTTRSNGMAVTEIDTNDSVPLIFYMGFADVVALIVATCLGAPFARENDGHLEIALTKPVSRWRLAFGYMLIDAAGIVAASAMTVVALYVCQLFFQSTAVDFSGVNLQALAVGIIVPLTWYAMLCAATASVKRGYGAVLGFAWPVAIVTLLLGFSTFGDSLLAHAVHDVFRVISYVNPLSYVSVNIGAPQTRVTFPARISVELALLALYSIAAVVQWRRVEA